MDQIDKLIEAWLNRWWPEPKPAESNVAKKPNKTVLEALNDSDLPF